MHKLPLIVLLLAPLAILTACKSGTASEANEPVSTPTVAAATTAMAEVAASATPQPTATPAARVIEIIGDEAFQAWTQRALELIETRAPEAYAEVLASIDVIESVAAGSGMYVEEKRFAVGQQTAYAPEYDEAQQLVWYAGSIVHDAHHSAMFIRGDLPTGKEAEVECLTVQKAALDLMADDPFFASYVQSLIDGADDPANQYWNQPDRHW